MIPPLYRGGELLWLSLRALGLETHLDGHWKQCDYRRKTDLLPDSQTHWIRLRTNNPLERIMRKIRRRTRVVGAFPDRNSALMLVAARLRHIAGTKWGTRRYLSMEALEKQSLEHQHSA